MINGNGTRSVVIGRKRNATREKDGDVRKEREIEVEVDCIALMKRRQTVRVE